jgi:putative transcriptional regulator
MSTPTAITAGTLLIAEPFMQDPNFRHTVVLLCHKTTEGAFGFVLNRPTGIKVTEVIDDFPSDDYILYEGGPVERDTIHFITTRGDILKGSNRITEDIYWGGDFEQLKLLIDTKQISTADVKFFIGYSGWDAGQIEDEMEMKSWILSYAKTEFVFETESEKIWRSVLLNLGEQYKFIANIPENPNLN